MDYPSVTNEQAVAMLNVWRHAGHDLPSLAKIAGINDASIIVLIPGYRCNNWYQVGECYSGYQEAMASIGALLDNARASV